jgi:hypothetical protein
MSPQPRNSVQEEETGWFELDVRNSYDPTQFNQDAQYDFQQKLYTNHEKPGGDNGLVSSLYFSNLKQKLESV